MIPRNQQNRRMQVDLACPTCAMNLAAAETAGFTRDGETYCCQGCADGTGCTCATPMPKRTRTKPVKGTNAKSGAESISRYPSRKAGARITPKRKRNLTKERDSTREQARGRSEFTGSLYKGGPTRVSRTGTKSART